MKPLANTPRRTAGGRRVLLLGLPVAATLLVGCGQVEDAARGAASEAATSAGDSVKSAAGDEVMKQVCAQTSGSGALADGLVSAAERGVIESLASAAGSAGLPPEYAEPLRRIGASTDEATVKKAVDDLRQKCAATPAS